MSAVGKSAGGRASPESDSCAHTLTHALVRGGVRQIEDWRVEARLSLVDAGAFRWVDQVSMHLVVGSSVGDGVVAGKVSWKIFPAAEVV